METTTRTRATAPAVFGTAFAAVAGDARCRPVAEAIRSHAVEVACLARELAPLVGADQGTAFAAGLLHDIGELLLMHRDPAGYLALLAERLPHGERLRREKALYDTDHALLGAEHLLELRMPDPVADAVADHHDPFMSSAATTVVVSAADELLGVDAVRRHSVRLLDIDGTVSPGHSEP
ncbi:HDOD domain-containing protein [Actinospongicola halichondriae]|uniref:HDOD domain-containing protein n=1 Tax=Actinospongicola halichondriae TaxID=3236844 RepID=UPI003D4C4D1D